MFRFGAYRRPQVTLDFTFDCGDYGVRIQLYKKVCNVQMGPLQVFRKIILQRLENVGLFEPLQALPPGGERIVIVQY